MTLPRSWRGASQGHQTAPSPLMATTSQAPRTCVHSHAQHSFLPAFIFRSNKHCSPDIQPAKHSPRLNWGRPCHSSTLQHTSTSTRASPLNPRAACSPPTPLRNLQILFLPVTHCAQKWPHPRHSPQLKTPKRSGSSPSLPAAPTPPLPLATLMGSPDTHLPLRGDPHQARRHAKAQAATVLAPAKGSPTEGPTQAFGQQGRPPDITGLAGSEPGLPGQRPALTNSPPLPACTATPKDGPKGAQAQTGSFLSPSDNFTSKRGTQTPTEHTQRERPGLKTGLAGWQQGGEGGNVMEGAALHAQRISKAQTSLPGLPGNGAPLHNAPANHTTRVPRDDLTVDTPPLLCFGRVCRMP